MKENNVFLLFLTLILFICGCDYRKMTKEEIAQIEQEKIAKENKEFLNETTSRLQTITYKNHSYILYHKNHTTYGFHSVDVVDLTHDPDCECHKSK